MLSYRKSWFVSSLVLALFSISASADGEKDPPLRHYDEVRNLDGTLRMPYDGIYQIYEKLSAADRERLEKISKSHFKQDNSLHLLPRVLTEGEFETLKSGVSQRARALKLFFEDHYSGKKSYLKNGLLPEALVSQIVERHGDGDWSGKLPPEILNWIYGPDILRLPSGQFAVIEDNFGYVGGLGDLEKAPETLFQILPEYRKVLNKPDPGAFYRQLVARYEERAKSYGGKLILVQYDPVHFADNEDNRIRRVFKKLGIEVASVTLEDQPDPRAFTKLLVKPDGVYFAKRNAKYEWKEEKVGYIITNADVLDLDGSSVPGRRRRLLLAAKDHLEGLEKPNTKDPRKLALWEKKKSVPRSEEIRDLVLKNSLGESVDLDKLQALLEKFEPEHQYTRGKLGVPGLLEAITTKKVGANYAPGLNFVEDKEFYASVPKLIDYYLGEKPILENLRTESFRGFKDGKPILDEGAVKRVFSNLGKYVIKGVAGMGGKEVWIGPKMKPEEALTLEVKIRENPSLFIFQDFLPLSVMEGNLVDLRLLSDVGPHVGDILLAQAPWGRSVPLTGDGKVNISASGNETTVFIRKAGTMPCGRLLKKTK